MRPLGVVSVWSRRRGLGWRKVKKTSCSPVFVPLFLSSVGEEKPRRTGVALTRPVGSMRPSVGDAWCAHMTDTKSLIACYRDVFVASVDVLGVCWQIRPSFASGGLFVVHVSRVVDAAVLVDGSWEACDGSAAGVDAVGLAVEVRRRVAAGIRARAVRGVSRDLMADVAHAAGYADALTVTRYELVDGGVDLEWRTRSGRFGSGFVKCDDPVALASEWAGTLG